MNHVVNDSKKGSVGISELSDPKEFLENVHYETKRITRYNSDAAQKKVAIIGATLSGIITALDLQQKGYDVTFFVLGSGMEGVEEVTLPFGKADLGLYLTNEPDAIIDCVMTNTRWNGKDISFQSINCALYEPTGIIPVTANDFRSYRSSAQPFGVDFWETQTHDILDLDQRVKSREMSISEWIDKHGMKESLGVPMSVRASRGHGLAADIPFLYSVGDLGFQCEYQLISQSVTSLWKDVISKIKNVVWNAKISKIKRGFGTVR
jgi:hypothetical protein